MDNENIDVNGLNDINLVTNLFSKVNGLGEDNCFLVVLNRDYLVTGGAADSLNVAGARVGAKAGGVAGGIVGGAIANSITNSVNQAVAEFHTKLNDKQKVIYNNSVYGGFLVNITSNGMGVIPLTNNNKIIANIKNFRTDIDNYVYFANDEIEKIELRKMPLRFSVKQLAVRFKNLGNVATPWTLPKKHKLISYQKENYEKLVNKLQK